MFSHGGGAVLQMSRRQIDKLVAYCLQYEFEDATGELTQADRVTPGNFPALEKARKAYRLFRILSRSPQLASRLAPPPPQIKLTRKYDLFFPVFKNPYELFSLASIPNWRENCRKAACFINEYWIHQYRPGYLLELLKPFDHIFIAMHHAVDHVAQVTGRPVTYLPLGTDVLRFSPLPQPPPRSIDVCNIGRRSPVTHQVLLRLARERRIHYHYDTISPAAPTWRNAVSAWTTPPRIAPCSATWCNAAATSWPTARASTSRNISSTWTRFPAASTKAWPPAP